MSSSEFPSWWSSWDDAHLRTCQERRSLAATPQQVLDYTNAHCANTNATDTVYWSLPDRCNIVEWTKNDQQLIQQVCHRFGNHTPSTPPTKQETSQRGGLLQSVTKTLSSTLWGALTLGRKAPPLNPYTMQEEDDALRDWSSPPLKEVDASNHHHEATKAGLLPWNQLVLNPSLTRMCLDMLQKELESNSSTSTSSSSTFPPVVSRRKNTAKNSSCWKDWLRQIDPSAHTDIMPTDFWTRLSATEADFLLECMAEMGHVTIIACSDPTTTKTTKSGIPKEELVVLGGNLHLDTTSMTSDEISMYHQVLASWWDLREAQESLEIRREQWSIQAQEYARCALKERQTKLGTGLASFKIHKLFLQRLEESGGTLLNLEQARHTLEESWHQRQVVQALEASTRTLQTLRQDTEQIDELMESYREEVEHVESVQESLSASILGDVDEDELMKDLERLTLLDDDTNIQKGTGVPSGSSSASDSISAAKLTAENTPQKNSTMASSAPSSAGESRQPERVVLPG